MHFYQKIKGKIWHICKNIRVKIVGFHQKIKGKSQPFLLLINVTFQSADLFDILE